jgi:hypothetical protein
LREKSLCGFSCFREREKKTINKKMCVVGVGKIIMTNGLFGLREMLKRERGTRETEKRCHISTIWNSREIAERD